MVRLALACDGSVQHEVLHRKAAGAGLGAVADVVEAHEVERGALRDPQRSVCEHAGAIAWIAAARNGDTAVLSM